MEEEFKFAGENDLLQDRIQGITDYLQEADESQGTEQTEAAPPPDPNIVDGQDIRNHPEYDLLRLDIPWGEEESRGEYTNLEIYDRAGYHKRWQDRIRTFGSSESNTGPDGRIDPIDNPHAIWLRRKHALTKEGDVGTEAFNSIKKGGLDLISSVLTAPERLLDMTTGQMQHINGELIDKRTGKPYKPDWDPLGEVKDFHQNSWWGKIAQAATHYGVGGSWMARFAPAGASLTTKALVGEGITAAISEYSQGDNVTGQIAKQIPWTEEVFLGLATKDNDHPLTLTFKNVLEEMSMAKLFGFIAGKFDNAEYAITKADNVDNQIREKGRLELEEEIEFDTTQRIFEIDRQLGGETIDVDILGEPKPITSAVKKELTGTSIKGQLQEGTDIPNPTVKDETPVKTTGKQKLVPGTPHPTDAKKVRGYDGRWVTKKYFDKVTESIKGANKIREQFNLPLQETFDSSKSAGKSKYKSGFRGHKNKPLAQPGQGSPASTGNAFDIHQQLNRGEDWGNNIGSTDSVMTPVAAQRGAQTSGFTPKFLKEKAKELLGDSRYQTLIEDAKRNKQSFYEVFEPSYRRYQEIMGRRSTAVDTSDFWEPIQKDIRFQTGEGPSTQNFDAWSMENVVAADLVNGALFKQLRDLGIAGKELNDYTDIWAADGLMKSIEDRLTFGLANVKRSRYLISTEFSKLKGPAATKAAAKRTQELHDETVDGVKLMMQMMKESESDELAQGILEVFSQSNKIQNWMDFNKWMSQKISGGAFNGKVKTGVLVKELQGMMVNSMLSGPKTPLRAIIGTTSNAYLNSLHTSIGAFARAPFTGDFRLAQASARNTYGMFEIIPDAWKVFRSNMESNFSPKVDRLETRYSKRIRNEDNWKVMEKWAEEKGSDWDKMAFRTANIFRGINDNRLFSWGPRALASVDDTFRYVMAKARSKELAFKDVYDEVSQGKFTDITPELLNAAEDMHYSRYFDEAGDLDITKDPYLESQFKEVTLTTELKGFSKRLEESFQHTPWAKPFFMFARTGVNGLRMNLKNTPILAGLVKESRDILLTKPNNLDDVAIYGIKTLDDLAQAKNLIIGRQVMGSAVVMMAAQKYLAGELTGSGPANRSKRQLWSNTGWERNTISAGNLKVNYDTFEPYNMILQTVANIGDNYAAGMGEDWATDKLSALAYAVTASIPDITSKSYLQGLNQFVELMAGSPNASVGRIFGNIFNNTIPLSSLRNEASKLINPVMRELSKSITDSVRNRNLALEFGPGEDLPIKYDLLNGKPLRDWNFMERMWNATSPIGLSLDKGPGRTLLWNSNYDLNLSVLSTPNNGPNLSREPKIRSLFSRAIGKQNLEAKLDKLAEREDVQASVDAMFADLKSGKFDIDPSKAYLHNDLIKLAFDKAKKKAWASIQNEPEVIRLMAEHKAKIRKNRIRRSETQSAPTEQKLLIPTR